MTSKEEIQAYLTRKAAIIAKLKTITKQIELLNSDKKKLIRELEALADSLLKK